MRAKRQISFWLAGVLILTMAVSASAQTVTTLPITDDQQLYEFIAEFINNGPANLQFGYLANVAGLGSVFSSTTTKNETTALFTIVVNANTFQVVNHGAFRITDRIGTATIYLNSGASDFTNPASFSQGTPIQVSSYRQTAIVNTLDNTFVSTNTHSITGLETFTLNGVNYRLGQLGKSFRSTYSGVVGSNQPPLVTGWFAGTAVGIKN
jgi:maltoporin